MQRDTHALNIALWGAGAMAALLIVYVALVSAISGPAFTAEQFTQNWYFLLALSTGFGIQVAMYRYLRYAVARMHANMGRGAIAATGTTSTLAMVSCCAHYLANIAPVLGIAGAVSIIAQYQTELFWVGIAFNALGMAYIGRKIAAVHKQL